MSSNLPTDNNPEDPFKGLEGLGEDLEDTFAELDGRLSDSEEADNPSTEDRQGSSSQYSGGGFDISGIGDINSFLEGLGDLGGLSSLFSEIPRMLQHEQKSGGSLTNKARGISKTIATGEGSEPNINPADRMAIESLMRVAELRVADATGLEPARGRALQVEVVNRTQWTERTFDDYSHIFETLSRSLTQSAARPADDDQDNDNPMSAMLSGIVRMLAPTMVPITIGSMVGQMAHRALGGYTLPVPRPDSSPVLVVLPNIDKFGKQWSLNLDDLRLCVCLHEAVYHAIFGVEHLRLTLNSLLRRHAAEATTNPQTMEELFKGIDSGGRPEDAFTAIQTVMGSPEELLGVVRSPAQEALLPQLTAIVTAITGFADHVMDNIGKTLTSDYSQLSEALRRQRLEATGADQAPKSLLGLQINQAQYDKGSAFASGVVERAGEEGLMRLLNEPGNLPTPAEVDAPGLWLARINLSP